MGLIHSAVWSTSFKSRVPRNGERATSRQGAGWPFIKQRTFAGYTFRGVGTRGQSERETEWYVRDMSQCDELLSALDVIVNQADRFIRGICAETNVSTAGVPLCLLRHSQVQARFRRVRSIELYRGRTHQWPQQIHGAACMGAQERRWQTTPITPRRFFLHGERCTDLVRLARNRPRSRRVFPLRIQDRSIVPVGQRGPS